MKTKKLDLKSLRNEEHFQFGADVIALVRKTGAALLRVEPQLAALEAMHADEDAVLERIRRSALTAKIDDADAARDEIFHGLRESVTAATRHYTPAAREAAGRLQIVFDTYGDLARRNYAEETAAVGNLLAELAGEKYAADCEALGLGGWIGELDRLNRAVSELLRGRDAEETAAHSDLVMKDVRAAADGCYRALVERVEALQVVEGDGAGAPWAAFIASLDTLVERYAETLAVRRGRAAAERAREEQQAAAEEGVDVATWRAMRNEAKAAATAR